MVMRLPRVIPVLLLKGENLVKTVRFRKEIYIGDPINTVRLFNEKMVDELMIIDITPTRKKSGPNLRLIEDLASEAFMPLTVGGGIRSHRDAQSLFRLGVEKIAIDSIVHSSEDQAKLVISDYGRQAVSVVMTFESRLGKTLVKTPDGSVSADTAIQRIDSLGPGEVILYDSRRDGTRLGYNLDALKKYCPSFSCPVVALGGAGHPRHFPEAIVAGAQAVAGGAYFSLQGRYNAPLISYPTEEERALWFS